MQKELKYKQLAFYGSFIEKHYIPCPHMSKTCKWRIDDDHGLYKHLNNACYLSGSFNLQCPVKKSQIVNNSVENFLRNNLII